MKNILKFGILVLSIAFVNCSKSSNDEDAPSVDTSAQSVKATLNGQAWEATKITSANVIRYTSQNAQRFDIICENTSQRISLSCEGALSANGAVEVKTYSFSGNADGDALFLNSYLVGIDSYGFHSPRTGTLTITSINTANKTVSGTFSFTAERSAEPAVTNPASPVIFAATNGVFTNVKYTVLSL
jgi:Family of unknown function (DUF6252)